MFYNPFLSSKKSLHLHMEDKLERCESGSTKIARELCRDPTRDNGRLNLYDDKEAEEK